MTDKHPKNQHLADMFKTAIDSAQEGAATPTPTIVVNGSHNVLSFGGGRVYVKDGRPPRSRGSDAE